MSFFSVSFYWNAATAMTEKYLCAAAITDANHLNRWYYIKNPTEERNYTTILNHLCDESVRIDPIRFVMWFRVNLFVYVEVPFNISIKWYLFSYYFSDSKIAICLR